MGAVLLFLVCFVVNHICAIENKCNDCVDFKKCPRAYDLALNQKNEKTQQLLRSSFCGFVDDNSEKKTVKVCCSYFGEPPLDEIESHPNVGLLPDNCGDIAGYRIIGGRKATLYEFPWMALISYHGRYGVYFKCAGSIINSRYILTATHCVQNQDLAGVRIGEYDIRYTTDCQGEGKLITCESHLQDIGIEDIKYRERKDDEENDIALLRLNKPINLSYNNAAPICLPVASNLRNSPLPGKQAVVAGWGLTENKTDSSILLKVTIPIRTDTDCARGRNYANKRPANEFCAGTLSKDSCKGDSGGPLMIESEYRGVYRYIQYGIVSRGPAQCGKDDQPGIYTDVRKHMKWILDTIHE